MRDTMLDHSTGPEMLQFSAPSAGILKVVLYVQLLFLLWLVIEDHDNLFIMAEVVHFLGIGVLIYKLWTKKNAGGEAIRPQGWQLHLYRAVIHCVFSNLQEKPRHGGLGCIVPSMM